MATLANNRVNTFCRLQSCHIIRETLQYFICTKGRHDGVRVRVRHEAIFVARSVLSHHLPIMSHPPGRSTPAGNYCEN